MIQSNKKDNSTCMFQKYRVYLYKKDEVIEEVVFGIKNAKELSSEEVISKAFYELFKNSHNPDDYTERKLIEFHDFFLGAKVLESEVVKF